MELKIGSQLRVLTSLLTEGEMDLIEEVLSYPNPEFAAQKYRHSPDESVPQFLEFFSLAKPPLVRTRILERPLRDAQCISLDILEYFIPRNIHLDKSFRTYPKTSFRKDLQKRASAHVDARRTNPANFQFAGTLRPYQDDFLSSVDWSQEDVILSAPCGHGKTAMSFWVCSKRQQKTLVIVPDTELRHQWFLAAQKFIPGASVMELTPKNFWGYEDCDMGIITVDLFSSRRKPYPAYFIDYWGHVIFDEAHIMGASTYHPIAGVLPAKYRTALSATFRRRDGLEEILQYHFGQAYSMPNQLPKPKVFYYKLPLEVFSICKLPRKRPEKILQAFVDEGVHVFGDYVLFTDSWKDRWQDFIDCYCYQAPKWHVGFIESVRKKYEQYLSRPNKFMEDSAITQWPLYQLYMSKLIKSLARSGKNVLVLSSRKSILEQFYALFRDQFECALLVGKQSEYRSTWDTIQEAQLVFGINQLAEQGFDAEHLDTLVYLTPMADTEQSLGRIRRAHKGKPIPEAYLPFFSPYSRYWLSGYDILNGQAESITSIKVK